MCVVCINLLCLWKALSNKRLANAIYSNDFIFLKYFATMTEMTEAAIISDYVREAYRPSFNKFINKNYEKVMNASVNIVTENAVDLQYHWMREYNIISRSTRPKSKVYSR